MATMAHVSRPLRLALIVVGLAVAVYGIASLTGGWQGEPPGPPTRSTGPAAAFDREIERRAVMRVVLMERYSEVEGKGRAKRFVLDPMLGSSILLLSDRDIARRREIGSKFVEPLALPDGSRARPPGIDGLDARVVADWAAHAAPSPTPRDLDVRLPIEWFTEVDWEALKPISVTGEGFFNDIAPEWTHFHVKHPDSAGWIHLTDVGFSANGATALIYVVRVAGGLDGSGRWFVLERRDGRWTIVKQKRAWVS
jgi:hypothetical protein